MAIPFQLPRCSESADDLQDLDRLLGDLFVVLARILAQRGQVTGDSVAALSAGRGNVTIRRPSRQLRLQVTDDDVDLELSSEESSSSDADSSVPPSPTSPTAPMPIPDLVSNLPAQEGPEPQGPPRQEGVRHQLPSQRTHEDAVHASAETNANSVLSRPPKSIVYITVIFMKLLENFNIIAILLYDY